MHARREVKDTKSYGREVSAVRSGAVERMTSDEEEQPRKKASAPGSRIRGTPTRKKKIAKFAGEEEEEERREARLNFAKPEAHPVPQRKGVKLTPASPPIKAKDSRLRREEGMHARFAADDVYEEIPGREEVSGSQASEDGFSSEANLGEEEDIPLSQLKGPVPLGSREAAEELA
eukprot:756528-Hanusia_phi.AAC.1